MPRKYRMNPDLEAKAVTLFERAATGRGFKLLMETKAGRYYVHRRSGKKFMVRKDEQGRFDTANLTMEPL